MGLKLAGDGVGTGFEGLLVDAVMGVGGEGASLAGLEVHDVGVGDPVEGSGHLVAFFEKGERLTPKLVFVASVPLID